MKNKSNNGFHLYLHALEKIFKEILLLISFFYELLLTGSQYVAHLGIELTISLLGDEIIGVHYIWFCVMYIVSVPLYFLRPWPKMIFLQKKKEKNRIRPQLIYSVIAASVIVGVHCLEGRYQSEGEMVERRVCV